MLGEDMCQSAECGDVFTIRYQLEYLGEARHAAVDSDNRNLFHKLFQIKQGHVVVISEYIKLFKTLLHMSPSILNNTDNNGDTPLHILAHLNPNDIMIHFGTELENGQPRKENPYPDPKPHNPKFYHVKYKNYTYVWKRLGETTFFTDIIDKCDLKKSTHFIRGCSMQNGKGNTPLHEAILAQNFTLFTILAKINTEALALLNNCNETVLHLLAAINPTPYSPIIDDELLHEIISKTTKDDGDMFDKDGLTPLIRAAKAGNIALVKKMCFLYPKMAELKDGNGETFWHIIATQPQIKIEGSSFISELVQSQLREKCTKGNTALHIALDDHKFDAAKVFLSFRSCDGNSNFRELLLEIPRNDGKTPSDLIGAVPYLPPDFEDFIWEDSTMIGIRSMWRIPTTRTENYVNTMGVIAALLTTITFTAAFTVPGGLNQQEGNPLLISDPVFLVFMISNVLAMCLSMMVLFCLLWIMATADYGKSVVLLDLSIILLLGAFYLTLLTFMTGLYATTYHVKRWVAILSLVLCCFFLLLMVIYLIGHLLIPSRKAILIYAVKSCQYIRYPFRSVYGLCKRFVSFIQKCLPWSNSPRQSEAQPSMASNGNDIETSTSSVQNEQPSSSMASNRNNIETSTSSVHIEQPSSSMASNRNNIETSTSSVHIEQPSSSMASNRNNIETSTSSVHIEQPSSSMASNRNNIETSTSSVQNEQPSSSMASNSNNIETSTSSVQIEQPSSSMASNRNNIETSTSSVHIEQQPSLVQIEQQLSLVNIEQLALMLMENGFQNN